MQRTVVDDGLRVIICLAFDHRAPFDETQAFKEHLIIYPSVINSAELRGSFDFMLEVAVPDLATYNDLLEKWAERFAKLVKRFEANFVCKRFVRVDGQDEAIWVPCPHGIKRVDNRYIDKVTAEGDYMRVHSGSENWLVHMTMREIREKLRDHFVNLHRSVVVRDAFIDRLIHHNRHWVARLQDGTSYRVAKSHVSSVMAALHIDSSPHRSTSAKATQPIEKSASAAHRMSEAKMS